MLSLFAASAHLKLFELAKTLFVVPVVLSGLWFSVGEAHGGATARVPLSMTDLIFGGDVVKKAAPIKAHAVERVKQQVAREELALRKLRVQRVLVTLDRVAEVALKMDPARAQALEPVILDIAEQTMAIKTDEELEQIETTVSRLVFALDRMVEPEMSL